MKDKDTFNGSEPRDDAQFAAYVTHPDAAVLIQALFGVAPPPPPRRGSVTVFLTGVPGLNQPENVTAAEMLRLNTNIAPVAEAGQNPLGVIGGDLAGFPNGRRPGDDVVDIALRAVEGVLLTPNPASFPTLTDGAAANATMRCTAKKAPSLTIPSWRLFPSFPVPADAALGLAQSAAPVTRVGVEPEAGALERLSKTRPRTGNAPVRSERSGERGAGLSLCSHVFTFRSDNGVAPCTDGLRFPVWLLVWSSWRRSR